jgi:predicted O-linked N-acetylglucosamine transferase (SPINDLY family)
VQLEIGQLYARGGRLELALACYERVGALQPGSADAFERAARAAATLGLPERACTLARRALRLRPSPGLGLKTRLALRAIEPSVEGIAATRARFARELDALALAPPALGEPDAGAWAPAFYLAYHGESNRTLNARLGALYRAACPALDYTAAHCRAPRARRRRLRVGFLSAHFGQHSIGKTSVGLIERLPRARFEVLVLALAWPAADPLAARIAAAADALVHVPGGFREAAAAIAALELDVLFFQDIGMDAASYFLAFARLAPVQCVSFGHPDTTGIPNMDYFVSNDRYESPGAAADYSESLFLLEGLPTLACYSRPGPAPGRRTRASFGFGAREHLYLCPQTLFKLHPDVDHLLGAILRGDPMGAWCSSTRTAGPGSTRSGSASRRCCRTSPRASGSCRGSRVATTSTCSPRPTSCWIPRTSTA